jgi:signal peptidase I
LIKRLGVVLLVLLAAASVVAFAFTRTYRVPGYSMSPSLRAGDRVLVFKFVGPVKPNRGDIVAYNASGIRCGAAAKVVFIHRVTRHTRAGRFVVRGDNRRASCDSRLLGPVPRDDLIGQVVAVYWPPSRWGFR